MDGPNWEKRVCAVIFLCATTAVALQGQTFTTLHSFDGTDGAGPEAALVQATDGNLYGTTYGGGVSGEGTVFKTTPSGTLTTLHSFDGVDGSFTYGGLVQSATGNFYGTTTNGGTNHYGTMFEIAASGTLTTLHSFCSQSGCADGGNPTAALIQANGSFYGTTNDNGANGYGTVFEITPAGALTALHSFCSEGGCADGYQPFAALVQATNGNFYGTTDFGGANGGGTVFKMTPSGVLTTLYSFCFQSGCTDGSSADGMVQAADGNFYGTTAAGGANGYGTVFKITPNGTLTTLYSFCSQSGCTDGEYPDAALVQATDGNFYATTYQGGANGYGTVFRITPRGTLTTLYSFCSQSGCLDGQNPGFGALIQDTNGKFYGTTGGGGAHGDGTVFSLSLGLGPFVEMQPTSGKAGAVVKILGTNLTGATSVTFNGTAAVFKVISSSLIGARFRPAPPAAQSRW